MSEVVFDGFVWWVWVTLSSVVFALGLKIAVRFIDVIRGE